MNKVWTLIIQYINTGLLIMTRESILMYDVNNRGMGVGIYGTFFTTSL